MFEPLDELFLIWLYSQVADPNVTTPSLTYWKVMRLLYTREFKWKVPNDDNRLEDGKDLRREFLHDQGHDIVDPAWIEIGCSVLELMVGLSRRLSFEADGPPYYWFWVLMENIGLHKNNDKRRWTKRSVDEAIDVVMQRQYSSNGKGGFFPLKYPDRDQRGVELWYQLSAYVLELSEPS